MQGRTQHRIRKKSLKTNRSKASVFIGEDSRVVGYTFLAFFAAALGVLAGVDGAAAAGVAALTASDRRVVLKGVDGATCSAAAAAAAAGGLGADSVTWPEAVSSASSEMACGMAGLGATDLREAAARFGVPTAGDSAAAASVSEARRVRLASGGETKVSGSAAAAAAGSTAAASTAAAAGSAAAAET